jgi:hypothetical protein
VLPDVFPLTTTEGGAVGAGIVLQQLYPDTGESEEFAGPGGAGPPEELAPVFAEAVSQGHRGAADVDAVGAGGGYLVDLTFGVGRHLFCLFRR